MTKQTASEYRCGEDGREYYADPLFYAVSTIVVTVVTCIVGFGAVALFGWSLVAVPLAVSLALVGTFAGIVFARIRGENHV